MRNTADIEALLYVALKTYTFFVDFDENGIGIPGYLDKALFIDDDGAICISVEYAHTAGVIGDFYGEFRGGYPWIHENVERIAAAFGYHTEWINPGCFGFWD